MLTVDAGGGNFSPYLLFIIILRNAQETSIMLMHVFYSVKR